MTLSDIRHCTPHVSQKSEFNRRMTELRTQKGRDVQKTQKTNENDRQTSDIGEPSGSKDGPHRVDILVSPRVRIMQVVIVFWNACACGRAP